MKSNLLAWVFAFVLVAGGAAFGCGSESDGATTGSQPAGCLEAWSCTPWETSGSDDQGTRTCTEQSTCGTTANKPAEAATLPALDENFFLCNVQPVLDRKCSQLGCHGTEEGRALRLYARGRLRNAGEKLTPPPTCPQPATADECTGSVICKCRGPKTTIERRRNYDNARAFALDTKGNPIPAGSEDTSELIAQPVVGGKAHAGIHLFHSDDAEAQVIRDWLGGASLPSCDSQN